TDKPTVPSDSCLEAWVVGCIKPGDAPAPAKARYGQAVGVRFTRCGGMRDGRVEIAHDLLVRHLGDDGTDLIDRYTGHIAMTGIQFRRDPHVTLFRQPPTDILDVLVHTEDLLNDEHDWKRPALSRHGLISGDLTVRDLDLG